MIVSKYTDLFHKSEPSKDASPAIPVASSTRLAGLPDLSTLLKMPEEIATCVCVNVIGRNLELFITLALVSPAINDLIKGNETLMRFLAIKIHGPRICRLDNSTWFKTLTEVLYVIDRFNCFRFQEFDIMVSTYQKSTTIDKDTLMIGINRWYVIIYN
jgi:hypothetical protein